jgi:hypothetical protein
MIGFGALLGASCWAAPPDLPTIESRIVEMCNQVRRQHGLGPLEVSLHLQKAAKSHSSQMWDGKFFGHVNPARPSDTLSHRLHVAGLASLSSAENLFRCEGYEQKRLAEIAVASWLSSPGHRANLLNPKFNRIGVGVCGQQGKYYFTQDFSSEVVSILSRQVRQNADGSYELQLHARVHRGPREGAILLDGKRVANWTAAADGSFEVSAPLHKLGTVQIGQQVAPRSWEVETEFVAERQL